MKWSWWAMLVGFQLLSAASSSFADERSPAAESGTSSSLCGGLEDKLPLVETFDDFEARGSANEPEKGDLDAKRWKLYPSLPKGLLQPNQARVYAPFGARLTVPEAMMNSLEPGYYAIEEPRGASLGLRAGPVGADATFTVLLPKDWGNQAFVGFRAFPVGVERPNGSDSPTILEPRVRLDFDWSIDQAPPTPLPPGSATFDDNGYGEFTPTTINLHLGSAPSSSAERELQVHWHITSPSKVLLGLDDIVVAPQQPVALVLVHVDSGAENEHFLRETLRNAARRRHMTVVTCEEDIETETTTLNMLVRRGNKYRDDAPDRAELLSKLTSAGCRVPAGARLVAAWLSVHEDGRSGRREATLRLRALADGPQASTPTMAAMSEPESERWAWSILVDRLMQRACQVPMPPTVELPKLVRVGAGTTIERHARATAGDQSLSDQRGPASLRVEWQLYRCPDGTSCDQLQNAINEFRHCQEVQRQWLGSESRGEPVCSEPDPAAWHFEQLQDLALAPSGIFSTGCHAGVCFSPAGISIQQPGEYLWLARIGAPPDPRGDLPSTFIANGSSKDSNAVAIDSERIIVAPGANVLSAALGFGFVSQGFQPMIAVSYDRAFLRSGSLSLAAGIGTHAALWLTTDDEYSVGSGVSSRLNTSAAGIVGVSLRGRLDASALRLGLEALPAVTVPASAFDLAVSPYVMYVPSSLFAVGLGFEANLGAHGFGMSYATIPVEFTW